MTETKASKLQDVLSGITTILSAAPYVGPLLAQVLDTIKRKEEYTDEEWQAVKDRVEGYKASPAWQPDEAAPPES